MDLGKNRVDVKKREEGDWVGDIPEFPGLRLKTRGSENKDWRRLSMKLATQNSRKRRLNGGIIDPEELDKINAILLRDTALLDWEGPTNTDGTPLPFSKEKAYEYLSNPANGFIYAAIYAANVVAENMYDETEADAKN